MRKLTWPSFLTLYGIWREQESEVESHTDRQGAVLKLVSF